MWASGDYPSMASSWLVPLGPRLVDACGIGAGMRVLDIGTGAGDVALDAARLVGPGGSVVGVDANPQLIALARERAAAAGRRPSSSSSTT
jgi:ubiquinone/menaquinone biosynthesis C-methylase UbiE